MNVDPKKIKELIMLYSQLDEEYQVKLLNEAYILLFKQTQKNQIKKENIKYATESDISITVNQKEISVKDYLDKYLSAADYDKAKKMTDKLFQDDKK